MKKLLIATGNPGKLEDYRKIFENFRIDINLVSLKDLEIKNNFKEDGATFEENSKNKAEFYGKLSGFTTLADDSGIEIDYLGGEPGVKSRRWPGYEASDEELIALTLKKMEGVSEKERGAQFRAIISIFFPEKNKNYIFEGIARGIISYKVSKETIKGYPYSSVFYLPQEKKYFSELNFTPHRNEAIKKAIPIIKKYLSGTKNPPSILQTN
jgi:XTP/dITP diphosphohydrolase